MAFSSLDLVAHSAAPEDYPWLGPAVRSALLLSDGIVDLDPGSGEIEAPTEQLDEPLVDIAAIEQALAAEGAAPLAERTLATREQSLAQMALAWALRDPRITSVLVGARTVEQLDNSLGALESPGFTEDELARINEYAVDGGINWWAESAQG